MGLRRFWGEYAEGMHLHMRELRYPSNKEFEDGLLREALPWIDGASPADVDKIMHGYSFARRIGNEPT